MTLTVVTGASGFLGGVLVPMRMAEALAPLGEWAARRSGREPLFTREGLHALRSDPTVSGAKAAAELGYQPRPFEVSVVDTYAWFQAGGAFDV